MLLEFFLVLAFTTLDLMLFFIFFESILIPMFFLIGIWGSKERRVRAAFYLMLYTIAGSVLLFFSLITLYFEVGSTSICVLSKVLISLEKQKIL
jgi:NADH:ubiquinone oxidoreductase subunit 4 (subunit M)